jgi:allantoicase
VIEQAIVDTAHFKGNYPDRCSVEGIYWRNAPILGLIESPDWVEIMSRTRMKPDTERRFPVSRQGPWTHLRLNVFPCGGVSRFHAHGKPFEAAVPDASITGINDLATDGLFRSFHRCCGSDRWAEAMAAAHPFQSRAEMFGVAKHIWWHLDERDWTKAFSAHPEIGNDIGTQFGDTSDLSSQEQLGLADAAMDTLTALASANVMYRERFGFIFLICATGKSGEEMLAHLRSRMNNPPENEIRIAAGEQAKITRLRLEKLL